MNQLIIEPLIGIGEIKFGHNLPGSNNFLGKINNVYKTENWQTYFFWDNQLSIETDLSNRISFIGLKNHGNLNFDVMLFGVKVFETTVDKMINTIVKCSSHNYILNDSEIPYSYKFPNLDMTLYREYLPSDCEDEEEKSIYEVFEYVGIGNTKS